ncbi:MAG: transposase [Pseudomonadota bacterium]
MRKLYAALDVSLEMTSICVVDEHGVLVLEEKAASEPEAILEILGGGDGAYERVGFEAGPLSAWLHNGLTERGLPAVCIEARHAKAAMVAMTRNKNDRNDARSLAQWAIEHALVWQTHSQVLQILQIKSPERQDDFLAGPIHHLSRLMTLHLPQWTSALKP